MKDSILSGSREPSQSPILLDLNQLYHPPKRVLTSAGIINAFMPLFGFGWQALTQDPETQFRHELVKRINSRKTDEANLILILQLAAMLDCHCLHIALPYVLSEEQVALLRHRLPRWQLTLTEQLLVADLPLTSVGKDVGKEMPSPSGRNSCIKPRDPSSGAQGNAPAQNR